MTRETTSIAVLAAALVALLILAPDVLLIVFAGILLAVLLRGGGEWTAERLGIAPGYGIAIFAAAIVVVLFGAFAAFAPSMAAQIDELANELPEAFAALRERIENYPAGRRILDRLSPAGLMSGESGLVAASAVTGTFGALGNFVIIVFVGLYGALDPTPYRRGLVALAAPALRERFGEVLDACVATLRRWLVAQSISMSVVGILTALGLWLVGVPLAFILGLLAGLLAFIPNLGPVLAAAPGLILAFPEGPEMVGWVLAIYAGVQTLESYVITPLVQQERVSLPAAFVIAVQLLLGVLFGLLGLALAMPMAALARTLTRELYVRDYLEMGRGGTTSPAAAGRAPASAKPAARRSGKGNGRRSGR